MVERRPVKALVVGSNPTSGASPDSNILIKNNGRNTFESDVALYTKS